MSSRPRMSGRSTSTWRSKRPGRSRAGSSVSGRLVAAMTITPLLEPKPSISTSSALSVCSRSSWPPTMLVPRLLPRASSSSMKMMQGAFDFGLLEHVAHAGRADADEHFDEVATREAEERHARLAGDGLGQQRLARARRADQQHALGNAAAERLILFGRAEEIDDFADLFDRFVDAGHVVERDAQIFLGVQLAAAAAERHGRARAEQAAEHEIDEQQAEHKNHESTAPAGPRGWGRRHSGRRSCFVPAACRADRDRRPCRGSSCGSGPPLASWSPSGCGPPGVSFSVTTSTSPSTERSFTTTSFRLESRYAVVFFPLVSRTSIRPFLSSRNPTLPFSVCGLASTKATRSLAEIWKYQKSCVYMATNKRGQAQQARPQEQTRTRRRIAFRVLPVRVVILRHKG